MCAGVCVEGGVRALIAVTKKMKPPPHNLAWILMDSHAEFHLETGGGSGELCE